MQTFTILSTLVAAASALALPKPAVQAMTTGDEPNIFKLKHATLGYVLFDTTDNSNLFFSNSSSAAPITTFIQDNKSDGIAFYARDTAEEIYLEPSSSGTSQYNVKGGNPEQEADPSSILSSDFTVSNGVFGYQGSSTWFACGNMGAYELHFGAVSGSTVDCTENFELTVEYQ